MTDFDDDFENEETVKFGYSASSNITFQGTRDSGILQSDWDEMSEAEQQEAFTEFVFELVDIWVD